MDQPTDSAQQDEDAVEKDVAFTANDDHREDTDEAPATIPNRKAKKILAEADRRDDEADIRDAESDKRSEAADLKAFLNVGETYSGHGERRAAAMDRSHSKSDRESSAADRAQLAEQMDEAEDAED